MAKPLGDEGTSGARLVRRGQARIWVSLPVVVEHATGNFHAIAIDLGLGGMFIGDTSALAYGTSVEIVVWLKEPRASRLPGLVRWSNESGFGVQFLELGARETYVISAFMALATPPALIVSL